MSSLPHTVLCDAMPYSGSAEGDLSIIDTKKLGTTQRLGSAHMVFVTSIQFSSNSR